MPFSTLTDSSHSQWLYLTDSHQQRKKAAPFRLFFCLAFVKFSKDWFEYLYLREKDFRILNFTIIYYGFTVISGKKGPHILPWVPISVLNIKNKISEKNPNAILEVLYFFSPMTCNSDYKKTWQTLEASCT